MDHDYCYKQPTRLELESDDEMPTQQLSPCLLEFNSDTEEIIDGERPPKLTLNNSTQTVVQQELVVAPAEPSFKREVELIDKHFYRKKRGTTFRTQWLGYEVHKMEETLATIITKPGGPEQLRAYLRKCSKRALKTLLEREPELSDLLKK